MANAQLRRIEAGGISFMTAMVGSGPRLLYISGTGGDLRQPNAGINLPLADQFEMLCYDQRGLGQTDKPPGPYTMHGYATDAVAVMDAYGWDRAHVVGYSFGGMVAQELAIGWPERIDRLVLGVTAAGGAGGASYPLHTLEDLPARDRARRWLELSDTAFSPAWQQANRQAAEQRIDERIAEDARFADEPGHSEGQLAQLEARSHHNTYDRLERITVPTLVISGSRDGIAPPAAGKAMVARIPGAEFLLVEGSHGLIREDTSVCETITAFLTRSAAS